MRKLDIKLDVLNLPISNDSIHIKETYPIDDLENCLL